MRGLRCEVWYAYSSWLNDRPSPRPSPGGRGGRYAQMNFGEGASGQWNMLECQVR